VQEKSTAESITAVRDLRELYKYDEVKSAMLYAIGQKGRAGDAVRREDQYGGPRRLTRPIRCGEAQNQVERSSMNVLIARAAPTES
jgi:hypothetical protein